MKPFDYRYLDLRALVDGCMSWLRKEHGEDIDFVIGMFVRWCGGRMIDGIYFVDLTDIPEEYQHLALQVWEELKKGSL